jgi:deoxyribonuclease-1
MKIILFIFLISISLNTNALTFSQAKNKLKTIYKYQPETFYCGCDIQWQSKKKLIPKVNSCGYKPRNKYTKKGNINKRVIRIEWEHIVPAWEFGHQLQCWQKGKRNYCAKKSKGFRDMEGDLHNLVPAIGEVNADRSNFKFGLIEREERVYGKCDVEVSFKERLFEPKPDVRGNIARTYFYFEKQYRLKMSKKQKQLFNAWDKLDPVDKIECFIHNAKAKVQGNENIFIAKKCHYDEYK